MEATKTVKRPIKNKSAKKPLTQKQIMMYGLGGGIVLGVGYLAYNYFRNKVADRRSIPSTVSTVSTPTTPNIINTPVLPIASGTQFPLKKGARGSLVQMLQNALLAKGGQAALIIKETSFRNGNVDGVFGSGTQRALRAAGFASALTQSQFTALVGKNATSSSGNYGAVAKEIIDAANTRNLFGVVNGLKKISSIGGYKQVSSFFQNIRILGIRVTSLVNALLSVAFKQKELEKVKIRAEFRRIGLKQNAQGIWFIPGLGGVTDSFGNDNDQTRNEWNLAIVQKPTLLKAEDGSFIIPELLPNTVVGYITGIQNGMTRILTQSGETVYAPTKNLSSF